MKKIIIIGLMLLAGIAAKSQDYMYTYDNNGNRTKREFIPLRKTQQDTTATTDSTANITDSTAALAVNQAVKQQQQQYVATLGEQKVTVFPNPTKGELKIDITNFAADSKGFMLVTDMQGKSLFKNENIKL